MGPIGGFAHDFRAVVGQAGYRKLLATRLASQLGDGALNVGLVSYVFFSPERAVTAGAAAGTFAILLLPYSLIGPFAGTLLDRWHRRQVMLVTAVLRGIGTVLLALLTAAGAPTVLLATLALLVIALNRFFLAGQGASLPWVVRPDDLVMGNSVTPTLGSVAAAVGGLVGLVGNRLSGGSDAVVLLIAASCFLLAGTLLLRLPRASLGPEDLDRRAVGRDQVTEVVEEMLQGLRHLRHQRPAGIGLVVMAAHRFCWAFLIVMAILIYRNLFYSPDDPDAALAGLAATFAASAIGIGLAAAVTPIVTRHMSEEAWITVLLVATAVLLLAPLLRLTEPVMVLTAGVLGLAVQSVKICVDTLVQRWAFDEFRGRAFSVYDMAFNVAMVVAAIVAALVLPNDGWAPGVLVALAGCYAAGAAYYWRLTQRPDYRPTQPPLRPSDRSE